MTDRVQPELFNCTFRSNLGFTPISPPGAAPCVRHRMEPSALYSSAPLVIHRRRATPDAVRIARRKKRARERLRRNFKDAGTADRAGREVRRLRNGAEFQGGGHGSSVGTEAEQLYAKLAAEVLDALHVVDSQSAVNSRQPNPDREEKVLTRAERIAMRHTRAVEKQKRKVGAAGIAHVRHRPPVPDATIEQLEDMTARTRRGRSKDFMPVAVRVDPSREMDALLTQSMRQLSNNNKNGSSGSNPEHATDHIDTDIWESRLVSQLSRPLGIESLLSSKPVPSRDAPADFVSDAPHLDARLFRKQDQDAQVRVALALGKPILRSGHVADPPLQMLPEDLARLIQEDDQALVDAAAQRKHEASFEGFLESLPSADRYQAELVADPSEEELRLRLRAKQNAPVPMFAYNNIALSAAHVMQRFARRRRGRKKFAATKIQAQLRAFLCYRDAVRERRRLNLTATCIQCIHRGNAGRRLANWIRFAPRLQQIVRMYLSKLRVEMLRRRRGALLAYFGQCYSEVAKRLFRLNRAAKVIQRSWRATMQYRSQRHNAAVKIQRLARNWLVLVREVRRIAATKLQSSIGRGAQARHRAWRVRCAVLAEESRRAQREGALEKKQGETARRKMRRWLRGPCPNVPGLQTLGWWSETGNIGECEEGLKIPMQKWPP